MILEKFIWIINPNAKIPSTSNSLIQQLEHFVAELSTKYGIRFSSRHYEPSSSETTLSYFESEGELSLGLDFLHNMDLFSVSLYLHNEKYISSLPSIVKSQFEILEIQDIIELCIENQYPEVTSLWLLGKAISQGSEFDENVGIILCQYIASPSPMVRSEAAYILLDHYPYGNYCLPALKKQLSIEEDQNVIYALEDVIEVIEET